MVIIYVITSFPLAENALPILLMVPRIALLTVSVFSEKLGLSAYLGRKLNKLR